MRVRDKRKLLKEHKSAKSVDKQQAVEEEAAMPTSTGKSATTTTAATATAANQQTPLPPTEKVAFDNRIKRKNVLALNEKVAALREYERQPVYKHVGRLFNCSPDQIKRITLHKEEILNAWEQRTRRSQDAKTQEHKVVGVSMLGKAVFDWIRRMMYYKDFIITDGLIQKMALQFKSSMGFSRFFPDQEWCDKFRLTYKITHNDTNLLDFGYADSHSVQIKDIAKDIMSASNREAIAEHAATTDMDDIDIDNNNVDVDIDDDVDIGESSTSMTSISRSSHVAADEDDADVDIDGGGSDPEAEDVKPSVTELNQLQTLPQLVRLPNVPTGSTHRVLLTTPIVAPGVTPSSAQTMTIIPLATLAQSITHRPAIQPKPLPMLDIKQEIKTEPKEPDEEQANDKEQVQVEEKQVPNVPTTEQSPVSIKHELNSDDEELFANDDDEFDDDDNGGRSSVTSLAEILAANVDDEKQYIEQTRAWRKRQRSPSPTTPAITQLQTISPPTAPKRRHDDNNNAGVAASVAVSTKISCAEARKYLKLLEEFALSKENYRLIELITRADEVMRELADE